MTEGAEKMAVKQAQSVAAFDIETIADRSLIEMLPPIEAAGNLKDPIKIKADLEKKQQRQIEEMGLDPRWNLICCIAVYDGQKEPRAVLLEEASHDSERKLLEVAWEMLSGYDFFVTFNGCEFDVPILNLHSLFNRVRVPVRIETRKYLVGNHLDLRAILSGWERFAPGNLDYYLRRVLGRSKPKQIDGSLVQHYWDVGMTEDIKTYCLGDARDTFDLYQAVKHYFPM
jgi:predicted PolB exonuclease-like 3'-5' exonuclease